MQFIEDDNYFQIQGWMRTKLNLSGNELLIYAIIHGFSQDGDCKFFGSIDYLGEFAGTSRPTTIRVLKSLVAKGLITRKKVNTNHGYCYSYQSCKSKSKDSQELKNDSQELKNDSQELKNDSQELKNDNSSVKKCTFKSKDSLPNNKDIINNDNKIYNKTYNKIYNKGAQTPTAEKKEKPQKHKYGEFDNVLLTDNEYKNLEEKLGKEKADAVVKNFSELKEMKGYTYKSDYLALLKWGIRAYEEQNSRTGSGKNGRFNKESLADRDFFAGTDYEQQEVSA